MKHINHRVHKWQVRDMQRQALWRAEGSEKAAGLCGGKKNRGDA